MQRSRMAYIQTPRRRRITVSHGLRDQRSRIVVQAGAMRRWRFRIPFFMPGTLAAFLASVAIPRSTLVVHEHPGGDHVHVHSHDSETVWHGHHANGHHHAHHDYATRSHPHGTAFEAP